jgi:hypothetical protein
VQLISLFFVFPKIDVHILIVENWTLNIFLQKKNNKPEGHNPKNTFQPELVSLDGSCCYAVSKREKHI